MGTNRVEYHSSFDAYRAILVVKQRAVRSKEALICLPVQGLVSRGHCGGRAIRGKELRNDTSCNLVDGNGATMLYNTLLRQIDKVNITLLALCA